MHSEAMEATVNVRHQLADRHADFGAPTHPPRHPAEGELMPS
jgi:hypothetical protein